MCVYTSIYTYVYIYIYIYIYVHIHIPVRVCATHEQSTFPSHARRVMPSQIPPPTAVTVSHTVALSIGAFGALPKSISVYYSPVSTATGSSTISRQPSQLEAVSPS